MHEKALPWLVFLAWPVYLVVGFEGRLSHFYPWYKPFKPEEIGMVKTSLRLWAAWLGLLGLYAYFTSFTQLLFMYTGPYFVFSTWLVVVTFLHHHEAGIAWYGNDEWNYVKVRFSRIWRVLAPPLTA